MYYFKTLEASDQILQFFLKFLVEVWSLFPL